MREKKVKKQTIFWDYDMSKLDLNDPRAKLWYLNRKLQFGDFQGVSRADLKKYLDRLDINAPLKELIANYLKHYA